MRQITLTYEENSPTVATRYHFSTVLAGRSIMFSHSLKTDFRLSLMLSQETSTVNR